MNHRHTLAYVASFGISGALSVVSTLVLVHVLGSHEYGRYALGFSLATLLGSVLFEWLRLCILRFSIADADSAMVDGIDWLYLVIIGITSIAILGWAIVFKDFGLGTGLALASVVVGFALADRAMARARAKMELSKFALLQTTRAFCLLTLGCGAAVLFQSGITSLQFVGLGTLALSLALGFSRRKAQWRLPSLPSRALLVGLAAYGGPYVVVGVTNTFLLTADRWFLSFQMAVADVGNYAAVNDLVQRVLVSVCVALQAGAFPAAMRAYQLDGVRAAARVRGDFLVLVLGIMAPAIIVLSFFGERIGHVVFPPAVWVNVGLLLPASAAAISTHLLRSFYFEAPFALIGNTRWTILTSTIAAAGAGAMWVLLIPKFGVMAVPMGLGVGNVLAIGTCIALTWSTFPHHLPRPRVLRLAAASGAASLFGASSGWATSMPAVATAILALLVLFYVVFASDILRKFAAARFRRLRRD